MSQKRESEIVEIKNRRCRICGDYHLCKPITIRHNGRTYVSNSQNNVSGIVFLDNQPLEVIENRQSDD